jgi:hypothetical protein
MMASKKTKKTGRRPEANKARGRKFDPQAGEYVAEEMREMKRGQLRSGRSKKKVSSRKQAIAIGLSKARREGAKVPPPPTSRKKATTSRKKATTSRKKATTSRKKATRRQPKSRR